MFKSIKHKPDGKNHLEGLEVNEWIIMIKMNLKEIDGSVWTVYMSQNKVQWRYVVNTAYNLRVPDMAGYF
jgi:hypothetical protein